MSFDSAPDRLLSPVSLGALRLRNRVVMAPLTRTRAEPGHVPGELIRDYYAQRAGAGLIISEATMVAPDASAFINEPGIYTEAQIAGWKAVTDAVHAAGGLIALQLWHPGRAAHPYTNDGTQSVSSTDRAIRDDGINTPQGKVPQAVPRRLTTEELPGIVERFRQGAENARRAGFDAVQVHGAHGYLLDQFLRDGVNDRKDAYGGSIEKRARLLFEVVDAVIGVYGADRVGLRISPLVAYNDVVDSNPEGLVAHVAREFERRDGAFFELRHQQHDDPAELELARIARKTLSVPLLRNGGYDRDSGEADLAADRADAIVYGSLYIANPDLTERFRRRAPLNAVDRASIYTAGPHGYTDYPTLDVA
jgi:N-ethylmaleimide reductase